MNVQLWREALSHNPAATPTFRLQNFPCPQTETVPMKHGIPIPCPSPGSHQLLSVYVDGTPLGTSWEWGPAGCVLLGLISLTEPSVLKIPPHCSRIPSLVTLNHIALYCYTTFCQSIHPPVKSLNQLLKKKHNTFIWDNYTLTRNCRNSTGPLYILLSFFPNGASYIVTQFPKQDIYLDVTYRSHADFNSSYVHVCVCAYAISSHI